MNEELKIKITAVVDQAKQAIRAVTNELGSFKEETEETAVSQEQLSQKVKEQGKQLTQLKKEYANIVAAQGKESAAAMNCASQISVLSASYASNVATLNGASVSSNVFSASALGAAGASDKMGKAAKSAGSAYEIFTKAVEENIDVISELGADVYTGLWDIIDKIGDAWEDCSNTFGQDHEISDALYEILEEAEEVNKAFEKFDTTTSKVGKDINKNLEKGEKALEDTEDQAKETGIAMEKIKGGAAIAGKAVAGAFAAAAAAVAGTALALGGLAESTRDYRTEQAKLTTAFESAGHSAEDAKTTYNDLYRVLGDTSQATEAANLFAKLTTNEQELAEWTHIAQGVYATFGDSLPIESLAEAANETAKTGQITGALADALNWAGVNEEEFAEQLFWANSEAEREKLIRNTLNGLYDEAAVGYEENAASILAANEAQAKLTESLAALGAAVEPIVTLFKAGFADTLSELVPSVETFAQGLLDVINNVEGGADRMKEGISGMVTSIIDKITELLPTLLTVGLSIITAILQGLTENFPAIAEAVGTALLQIVDAIGTLLPQITETLLNALPMLIDLVFQVAVQLFDVLGEILPEIVLQIVEILPQIVDTITKNIPVLLQAAIQFLLAIVQAIPKILPPLVAALPLIIDSLLSMFLNNYDMFLNGAIQLLLGLIDAIPFIIPPLVAAIPKIIGTIKKALAQAAPQIKEGAIQLLFGVIQAIGNLAAQLPATLAGIIKVFKDELFNKLAKIFDSLKFKFPDIKLPKFSVKPAGWKIGDLLKGEIPKLDITWNARGGVFDKPTLMSYGGSLQGIGEAGAEAVVPLENNLEWLDKLANMLNQRMGGSDRPIVLQVDGKTFAKTVINTVNADTRQKGKLALNIV